MFGIHRHQYPVKWTDAGTFRHMRYGAGLVQEKRCTTCGKVKRAVRFASF